MTKVLLQIDALGRGEAIARHEGQVVFVEGAVPGDVVEAELPASAERSVHARLLRVVEPSRDLRKIGSIFCISNRNCDVLFSKAIHHLRHLDGSFGGGKIGGGYCNLL